MRNVQPLFAELEIGGLGIAHNGNLTNAHERAPGAGEPTGSHLSIHFRHRGHHPSDGDDAGRYACSTV